MGWWKRRREGNGRPAEPLPVSAAVTDALDEECAAFLVGRYGSYLESQHRRVPMWARLNPLCHRDEPGLAALARSPNRDGDGWGAATAYLAEEVLCAAARHGTTVADIQRSALIPLELQLASKAERVVARPSVLVRAVEQVLREDPNLRHPIG